MVIEAMRRPLVERLAEVWEVPVSEIDFMGRLGVSDLEYVLTLAQEVATASDGQSWQDGYDEGRADMEIDEYDRGFSDGQDSMAIAMAEEVDKAYDAGFSEGSKDSE